MASDTENLEEEHESVGEVKAEKSVCVMPSVFLEEFGELFAEKESIPIDDDITIIISNNKIPMPIAVTQEDLVKRQNDWLSGNLPFNDSVSILKKCNICFLFKFFMNFQMCGYVDVG